MRKPLLAGNWKMFKNVAETRAFFQAFKPLVAGSTNDIVLCPPFVNIGAAVEETTGSNVSVGAQNLYWGTEGAFTGEVSGPMLKSAGCGFVIVGHSERRQFFGETDATVLQRTQAALEHGLTPIICVGETLAEREANRTDEVLTTQFDGGIAGLSAEQFANSVIAYEPVWAIGTGKVATPEMAATAHRTIRQRAATKFGADAAAAVRILYGGSVNPGNVKTLMAEEEIDGALVGGASLKPDSFAAVVNFDV
jgi:triosephosphate isomerase